MSLPSFTVLDFYNILYRITKNFPQVFKGKKDLKCKRAQTFAVLHTKASINSENLNKSIRYKGKDLFFSRKWEDNNLHPSKIDFEYPAVFIAEDDTKFDDPFCSGDEDVSFAFFGLDKMPTKECNFATASECELRTFEEVGEDIKNIVKFYFHCLGDFEYMRFEDSNGWSEWDWQKKSWLEKLKENGDISDYETLVPLTNYIVMDGVGGTKMFNVFNDGTAGFFTRIKLQFDNECPNTDINFNDVEVKPINDNSGCC